MANRWWIYQRERFPLLGHGPLIAAFSLSAVSLSRLLRHQSTWPDAKAATVAFLTSLIFFLQLRIADEFKDFAEDARYRPYRPVPRGLVKLRELGVVGFAGAMIQAGLAFWLDMSMFTLLAITWTYLVLMSNEFFVGGWLKRRPVLYMASHMAIVPLIDLYATGCDWRPAGESAPDGLIWFLLVSYFNGITIEVGRKLRAPDDEEVGVETYSALWGRRTACGVWFAAMLATAGFALVAATRIDWAGPSLAVLGVLLAIAVGVIYRFLSRPIKGAGKAMETLSGVWTIVMYLNLGAIPLAWRAWG